MGQLNLAFLGTPEVRHAGQVVTFRTRCLVVVFSAMNTLPAGSTATSAGAIEALVACTPSLVSPPPPARVVNVPSGVTL